MNERHLHEMIDNELAFITIAPALRTALLQPRNQPKKLSAHRYRPRRLLIAAIAVAICIVISVPVLGATVPAYNNILSRISPELAEFLMPRSRQEGDNICVTVDNGIEVAVVSAIADDYNMLLLLEIRDIREERLAEGVLPEFDWSSRNGGVFDAVSDYDEATGTLTVLWYETSMEQQPWQEETISFNHFSFTSAHGWEEMYLNGNWELSFMPAHVLGKNCSGEIICEGYTLFDITLSPIALTMSVSGDLYAGNNGKGMVPIQVEIVTKHGETYRFTNEQESINYSHQMSFYYFPENERVVIPFATALDLDTVVSVTVNAQTLQWEST